MAKLFVVATPFQLLVAQQVVQQEGFKDAVLLESYVGIHRDMLRSYEVCRIDSLWVKRLHSVGAFPSWDNGGVDLLHTAHVTMHRYRKIRRILEDNNVDSIFLADYQNQTYRFMTILFARLGYKMCFYEEGYSQYVIRPYVIARGVRAKLKELFLDGLYYLPLYHIKFAYWRNSPNRPYYGLPIYRRYSIVPGLLKEVYDVQLHCKTMLSEKLKAFLKHEMPDNKAIKKVLLLTDPMSEVLPKQFRYLYFNELEKAFTCLDKETTLYIKYHPRDTLEDRKKTEALASQKGVKFKVISSEVNIPVEYFLQAVDFESILFFNTSTYFYNGYLFPKKLFHSLLPDLLINAINNNVPKSSIDHIQRLIDKMAQVGENHGKC